MPLFRKCSGLVVTSYNKNDNKNRLFKKRLAKSLKQYKAFKKNPKLKFNVEISCIEKHHGGCGIDKATAIVNGLGAFKIFLEPLYYPYTVPWDRRLKCIIAIHINH